MSWLSWIIGIPGLLGKLWGALTHGGAYAAGRLNQRTADKLAQAESANAALHEASEVQRKQAEAAGDRPRNRDERIERLRRAGW